MNINLSLNEVAICAASAAIAVGICTVGKDIVTKVSAFAQKILAEKNEQGQISEVRLNEIKNCSEFHGNCFIDITIAASVIVTAIIIISIAVDSLFSGNEQQEISENTFKSYVNSPDFIKSIEPLDFENPHVKSIIKAIELEEIVTDPIPKEDVISFQF